MNVLVSSSKRNNIEVVECGIHYKHKQPRVSAARDYPMTLAPVQQMDYAKKGCLKGAGAISLRNSVVDGNECAKKRCFKSSADGLSTQKNLDTSDFSKLAMKLDKHVPDDTNEQKPKDTPSDTLNQFTSHYSKFCDIQCLSVKDCLKIQPFIYPSVKKIDKYTPRKSVAKRTYPPGCGPKAFCVKVEANGSSSELCFKAMPRAKLKQDIKVGWGQRYPCLLKKTVKVLAGQSKRPIGSASRPVGLVGRKFVEAERYCKKTIKRAGSSHNSIRTRIDKTAENSERRQKKELIDRQKIKKILCYFQALCRKFLQEEQSKCHGPGKQPRRVDNEAFKLLKENGLWLGEGRKYLGSVPGIRVGDEFHYRIELCLTGLHPPTMAGIAFKKINGKNVATSIVSSGGYNDSFDSSNILFYEGEGGHPSYQKHRKNISGDQKLERGNSALANSIDAKSPVRVIHGFREQSSSNNGKVRSLATYVYDGLYMVEHYWSEMGSKGFSVFKFRLKRMPNQEPLPQKEILMAKQKKTSRIGHCIEDISEGTEAKPIGVVNTIDRQLPKSFIYRPAMKYPTWYKRAPQRGCCCIGKCSNSKSCACAARNGGEFPFNYDGAIAGIKPLVYECGPRCSCSPSCYNRVSQHKIKFQLEVFKTKSRGWGVRSLASIPSGSFVCEYTGELLTESDAQKRSNDEYMFQIGHNYNESFWEGLSTCMPELQDGNDDDLDGTGFIIDAARHGSIARFINHSCSPNLFAQNVLYDHDDKKVPHIMFFAYENIPPLTELCYHYNYNVGQVLDMDGNVKEKACYCGSPHCTGRLY